MTPAERFPKGWLDGNQGIDSLTATDRSTTSGRWFEGAGSQWFLLP